MKRLNLAIIVVFLLSCFLTTFTTYATAQEEVFVDAEQAVYSGPTQFMVRDTDLGPNVYNQYNIAGPLPSWWTPPFGWEILAAGVIIAAIFPAFYDYGVSGIYFREASFIHHRFHGREGHFRDFNRRIGPRFNSHFHSIARGRHFDPKSVRGPGGHGPGGMRQPGRVGPPPKAGTPGHGSMRQPGRVGPPPKAGVSGSGSMRQPGRVGSPSGMRSAPPSRMAPPSRNVAPRATQPRQAPPRMAPPRQATPRPQQQQMRQQRPAQQRPQQQQMRQPRPAQQRPAQNRPAPSKPAQTKKNPNQK